MSSWNSNTKMSEYRYHALLHSCCACETLVFSVSARLGKVHGAKEIGCERPKFGYNLACKRQKIGHSLECERPKFGYNLARKRQKIGHSLERERPKFGHNPVQHVNETRFGHDFVGDRWKHGHKFATCLQFIGCLKTQKQKFKLYIM